MGLQVWWGSGSPYAWRALLALMVKGVDYESTVIQFSKREHKSDFFLSMNPRGKVPVLRDGDYTLYESMAIVRYLDARYPEPPLWGTTPEDAGRIERVIQEFCSYTVATAEKVVAPILFRSNDLGGVPEQAEKLHGELAKLESSLERSEWLVPPSRISAADISVYPHLQLLLRAGDKESVKDMGLGLSTADFRERYPNLTAWNARIAALPGYEATYPPHWRA